MGRRGPRPTPTAILQARNSKRAIGRRNEPAVAVGIPDMPEWLDAGAREHWQELAPRLHASGLMALEFREAFTDLCHALALRDQVAVLMDKMLSRVRADDHEVPRALRELRKIEGGIAERCSRGYAQFGMAPAHNDRVSRVRRAAPEDEQTKARFFKVSI